jgi:hypothetical protein
MLRAPWLPPEAGRGDPPQYAPTVMVFSRAVTSARFGFERPDGLNEF